MSEGTDRAALDELMLRGSGLWPQPEIPAVSLFRDARVSPLFCRQCKRAGRDVLMLHVAECADSSCPHRETCREATACPVCDGP